MVYKIEKDGKNANKRIKEKTKLKLLLKFHGKFTNLLHLIE